MGEACANVIRHAYEGRDTERIVLTFTIVPEGLEIRVRDFGPVSDPQTFKPRDLSEIRPGGLGLHFIRSAMDEIGYETPEGGGMLLRMTKYRPREEAPKL